MIFMKVENGVPNGIELELGDIETPLQDLIDEQSFYLVADVTVYDEALEWIDNPSYFLNVDTVEKTFTVTPKTVEEIRSDKKEAFGVDFNADSKLGFTTNDIKMNSDLTDVLRFDGGVRLSENLGNTHMEIRDFDNVVHIVTITEAKNMVDELGANYQMLLSSKWAKSSELDEATTVTAVSAISWA